MCLCGGTKVACVYEWGVCVCARGACVYEGGQTLITGVMEGEGGSECKRVRCEV